MASPQHDDLVRALAHLLLGLGFRNVRACVDGYGTPFPVDLREHPEQATSGVIVPDVTARSASGRLDAFAVETPTTLKTPDSAHEWRSLAAAAELGILAFWVAVPQQCRRTAVERLHDLQLAARIIGL